MGVVGVVLLGSMIYTGAHNYVQAWPVSSYPDFRIISTDEQQVISFAVTASSGSERALSPREIFGAWTTPDRYDALLRNVLGTPDPMLKLRRVAALWRVAHDHVAAVDDAVHVVVYVDVFSTRPSEMGHPPIRHDAIYTFGVEGGTGTDPLTLTAYGQSISMV